MPNHHHSSSHSPDQTAAVVAAAAGRPLVPPATAAARAMAHPNNPHGHPHRGKKRSAGDINGNGNGGGSAAAAAAHHLLAASGGAAAQTASLGERDMMTYVPPGGGGGGGGGGRGNSGSGGNGSGAMLPPPQQPQHELTPADDAALTAMSADLFDIFGDGRSVGGSVGSGELAGGIPAAHQQAAAAAQQQRVSDLSSSGRSDSSCNANGGGNANAAALMSNLPVGASELSMRLHGGPPQQAQALHQRPVLANPPGAVGLPAQQQQQQQQQQQAMAAAQLDPLFTLAASQFNVTPQQVASSAAAAAQAQAASSPVPVQQPNPLLGMGVGAPGNTANAAAAVFPPPQVPTPAATGSNANSNANANAGIGVNMNMAMPHQYSGTKRPRPPEYSKSMVSEDESDKVKRRRDRNAREQQRSQQITAQINHLRDVLTDANVQFKPDKYSTLVGVADYIKSLQSRKALLDVEHGKLLDTIRKTSDVLEAGSTSGASSPNDFSVGGGLCGGFATGPSGFTTATSAAGSDASASMGLGVGVGGSLGGGRSNAAVIPNTIGGSGGSGGVTGGPSATSSVAGTSLRSISSPEDELLVFVRGLDYKNIFSSCGIALGIAAIDGRLVDCNDEFVALSGRNRADLVGSPGEEGQKMSLFNLLGREGMEDVFRAMSDMLRSVPIPGDHPGLPSSSSGDDGSAPSSLSSSDGSPRESQRNHHSHGHGRGDGGRHNPSRPPHHVTFADHSGGATGGKGGGAPGQIICQRSRSNPMDHWSGVVTQSGSKGHRLRLNLTLVRSTEGTPKFFNCALSHLPEI